MPNPSRNRLLAALGISVLALLCARGLLVHRSERSNAAVMRQAEALADRWSSIIEGRKTREGIQGDEVPPFPHSGMLGVEWSEFTTTLGSFEAKRTAANPRFAALIVRWLHEAGVDSSSMVGVVLSGSFPSLAVAALAAVQTIGAHALVISSLGASSFGANQPGATWLDMESWLAGEGGLRYRSVLVTLGAEGDSGGGLSDEGLELLRDAAARHGLTPALFPTFEDAVRAKDNMLAAADADVVVNIGGNQTSLGTCRHASALPTGLVRRSLHCEDPGRGLIERCSARGLPVVHLLNVRSLASQYGLPLLPGAGGSLPGDDVMSEPAVLRVPLLLMIAALFALLIMWVSPLDAP
jgi:poly-gamma-glutamate system protein